MCCVILLNLPACETFNISIKPNEHMQMSSCISCSLLYSNLNTALLFRWKLQFKFQFQFKYVKFFRKKFISSCFCCDRNSSNNETNLELMDTQMQTISLSIPFHYIVLLSLLILSFSMQIAVIMLVLFAKNSHL